MPADLVPAAFAARMRELPAEGGPTGEAWVDGLPRLLDEVLETWELKRASGNCRRPLGHTHAVSVLSSVTVS